MNATTDSVTIFCDNTVTEFQKQTLYEDIASVAGVQIVPLGKHRKLPRRYRKARLAKKGLWAEAK